MKMTRTGQAVLPLQRRTAAFATSVMCLLSLGAAYGATNLRSAERFDAATNEWVTLPNMQVSVGLFVVHAGLFCLTEGVLVV